MGPNKNMSLDEIVEFLRNSSFRLVERNNQMGNLVYHVKAYKIGPPYSLIRVDIKESTKE